MTSDGRPSLSREYIAETALRLTQDDGLSGLSMRKLGAELGVEAMSLYHYVSNKADLLDAMLELLYDEIELPYHLEDNEWEQAVREGLGSFREVLLRHPAAVELFTSRPTRSKPALELLYWSYRRFEVMGLSPEDSLLAFRFIVAFVMGNASNEIGGLVADEAGGVDPEKVEDPAIREFVLERQRLTEKQYFDAGMDIMIAGLRAKFDLP